MLHRVAAWNETVVMLSLACSLSLVLVAVDDVDVAISTTTQSRVVYTEKTRMECAKPFKIRTNDKAKFCRMHKWYLFSALSCTAALKAALLCCTLKGKCCRTAVLQSHDLCRGCTTALRFHEKDVGLHCCNALQSHGCTAALLHGCTAIPRLRSHGRTSARLHGGAAIF